ncbi:hypothetical protein BpHYR1_025152 [Brachionus plicatilis]|uniref:Uncharacterized protein n=1 Tax=Brachionus plicatilis TaxID=10195 RepID=A0A3M7RU49_BRAPC|nr:hypothetical protein BpHYR1_025152 [Brachionus plicatilis]
MSSQFFFTQFKTNSTLPLSFPTGIVEEESRIKMRTRSSYHKPKAEKRTPCHSKMSLFMSDEVFDSATTKNSPFSN